MNNILVLCTTDSMIYYFLIPHIKDLQAAGNRVCCACSRTGEFLDILIKEYGLEVYEIDFKRSPYNLQNAKAYLDLNRLVKNKNINIIFCHEPVGGAMGRMVGHNNKCKVIYMAHGFHFYKGAPKSSRIYYFVEKYLSRFTDILITINQEDFEASQNFYARRTVKMNGIGVDTSRFSYNPDNSFLRKELGLKSDTVLLLSVGELIERKNHKAVIKAMHFLPENYHYVIAGDGELAESLYQMIQVEQLSDRVHLLGYRKDISRICNSSDIFVLPSYQEGISVAMMEAMACNLPVVASRIRGNVDLIDEDKGGYLVPANDSREYADKIEKIRSNNLEKIYGNYNRKKVKSFDIEEVRKQMRKVFEDI